VYQKALFDAFVWSQAVEELVRDLVCRFDPCKRGRVEKATFGKLINYLERYICADLFERLKRLRCARNDVVHRSSYVTNILVWNAEPDRFENDNDEEIECFRTITICAGDLYGELLDLID